MASSEVSRRTALKMAVTAIIAGVIAGVGGFYLGSAATPPPKTITQTTTQTITKTITKTITQTTTPTPKLPKTIKIGIITNISGRAAPLAKEALIGYKLAVEEINEKGGVYGSKLELVIRDNRGSAEETVAHIRELHKSIGVAAILGALHSDCMLAARNYAEENEFPIIWTSATNPWAAAPGTKWFTHLSSTSYMTGTAIARFMIEHYGKGDFFAIVEDSAWGRSGGEAVEYEVEKLGGKLETIVVPVGETNFYPIWSKIKGANADAVTLYLLGGSGATCYKQAIESGVKPETIVLSQGYYVVPLLKALGKILIGAYLCSSYTPLEDMPSMKAFVEKFKDLYGFNPTYFSAEAYDAVYTIYYALLASKSLEPAKLRDAIRSVKFDGATGIVQFDEYGQQTPKKIYIMRIEDVTEKDVTFKLVYTTSIPHGYPWYPK